MSNPRNDPRLRRAAPLPPIDLNPRREAVLDFPDRDLGELAPSDYEELGFMSGLEVHQQLLTETKLFCRCPAGLRTAAVDAEVLRHMRPTLSELGEYDGCALMEFKTRKEIIYRLSRACVCTYEMDDTPPFQINNQAVQIALEIARLFDLKLVSELHVMRKQYLDGSIPTGFQRTAMVGVGGEIPFRASQLDGRGVLRIRQLTIEEDSCREVSDIGHRITFRTDRLGTPLIETVTEPDLRTPHDVAAGIRLLASVARASRKVRRGAGTARQDINVSIAGSRRVEIKGVPSWRIVPRLVHNEAFRQLNLLRIRAELQQRGIDAARLEVRDPGPPWDHSDLVVDARRLAARSDFAPIQTALERGEMVCAVKIQGFGGLLAHPTQPGYVFAHEFAERARVIACLTGRPFMIASNVEAYGLHAATWRQLRNALAAGEDDDVVVLWGPEEDAATAAREVLARAQDALAGVPSETRQARVDGTTGFERILPGPERMYPDTDTPPLPIPDEWVETIEARLPERPWQRADRYLSLGVPPAAAGRLAEAAWADLFDALAPRSRSAARRLAFALEKRLPAWWRRRGRREPPAADRLRPLVAALETDRMHANDLERALDALLWQHGAADAVLAGFCGPADPSCLELEIDRIRRFKAVTAGKARSSVLRWAMGEVMPNLRGRVDPGEVRSRLLSALDLDGAGR